MTERKTQPSNVATEEAPRPPDEHVVTSDIDFSEEKPAGPREAESAEADAAGTVTTDESEGPTTGESSDATPPEKAPPKRRNRSAERRIKTLSSKLAAAEAREAENAHEIEALKDQVAALTDATPKAKEPMLQDFDNPRDYAKAYAKWEAAQSDDTPAPRKRSAPKKPAKPIDDGTPPATPQDPAIQGFHERGKAKLGDDFLEALELPGTAVNQVMGEFMIDCDVGPELYVHLADNQEESKRIYDLPAHKAIKVMERLATKARKGELIDADGTVTTTTTTEDDAVTADAEDFEDRTRKQIGTKAPAPPSNVKPEGDAELPANPETESMDEYAARRQKEELRKRGIVIN